MKRPIKKIVVGIDFSERCWAALKRALYLAKKFDATIEAIHILQDVPYDGASTQAEVVKFMGQLEEESSQEMDSRVQEIVQNQVKVETHVRLGVPYRDVLEWARETDADLVIVGNESLSGLEGMIIGRTCEAIVRRSPLPVWIERINTPEEIKNILIPTDFSEPSKICVTQGIEWAQVLGAKVFLIHVVEIPFVPSFSMIDPKDYENAVLETGQKEFDRFVSSLPLEGISHEVILASGAPSQEINKSAKEKAIDLLIISNRGGSGMYHKFMGKVAIKVLRHAKSPVLIFRPKELANN